MLNSCCDWRFSWAQKRQRAAFFPGTHEVLGHRLFLFLQYYSSIFSFLGRAKPLITPCKKYQAVTMSLRSERISFGLLTVTLFYLCVFRWSDGVPSAELYRGPWAIADIQAFPGCSRTLQIEHTCTSALGIIERKAEAQPFCWTL